MELEVYAGLEVELAQLDWQDMVVVVALMKIMVIHTVLAAAVAAGLVAVVTVDLWIGALVAAVVLIILEPTKIIHQEYNMETV